MGILSRDNLLAPALAGTALLGGLACGGGGEPTGVDDGEDTAVDVAGTWEFVRSFNTEFGATMITATLDLQQNGSVISGTHRDGTYKSSLCGIFGCTARFVEIAPGPVQGSIQGQTVVLEFNADDLGEIDHFEGTVSGQSIQGSGWSATRGTGGDPGDEEASPAAPTSLDAVVVETQSGRAVRLTWQDNADNEDGFVVFHACDAGGEDWQLTGETPPDATEFLAGGPFDGPQCTFAVLAIRETADDFLVSDPSNFASVTIPYLVEVTGLSPSGGAVGTRVTIQGAGFTEWNASPLVEIAGHSATEFIESVADDAILLLMPNGGGAGAHEVTVTVGGTASDHATWTQQGDEDPTDPGNDDPSTAPDVPLPLDIVGSFSGGDVGDFHAVTLASPATLIITLDWNTEKDIDIYVTDPAFETEYCAGQGATTNKPETISCQLPAGDYLLLVYDYDAAENGDLSLVSYRLSAGIP